MKTLIAVCALAGAVFLSSCGQQQGDVAGEIDRQEKAQADAVGQNLADGQQFLAANKAKAGVVTTPSGLQYEVIREGDKGKKPPGRNDTVSVMYEGALINGQVFDSSYERKAPASFQVGGVISGWTEALQLMHPGSEFRLVIPPELAYGEQDNSPDIPPNSVLVFKVELLGYETAAGIKVGKFE